MFVSTKTVQITKESSEETSTVNFTEQINLLDLFNANNISISQSCGGYGICTTCRIFVTKGIENLTPKSETEIERAEERDFLPNERLCCQTEAFGSVEVTIPSEEIPY